VNSATTLVELLTERAAAQSECEYVFVSAGTEQRLSFAALAQRAHAIGAAIAEQVPAGSPVLLLYPPGLDYVAGFFGCACAPALAVPIYPPEPARLERSARRLLAIAADARPRAALTTSAILGALEPLFAMAPALRELRWIATDVVAPAGGAARGRASDPESAALLQYTSGSTGTPKGVLLSHRNLLHNSERIRAAFAHTRESRGVIWLPPYHDMGLIGGIVQPLYAGFDVVLMSPLEFLARPMSWLEAVSRYRATTSGGPNFAYDLCVRKSSAAERAALDLSSWSVAFNGAEPVRKATLDAFAAAFAPAGFDRRAFFPCYGLAESTLIATGGPRGAPPRTLAVSRRGDMVGSGRSFADSAIAIVAPETRQPLGEGEVGEIWLGGPSVALGYFGRPDETQQIFGARLADGRGPFLRTGDLGFLRDGELFVTGRQKDLIIIRGRNHAPDDIEQTAAAAHPGARPGCTAAFAIEAAREELVIVQEVSGAGGAELALAQIVEAVAAEHELRPDRVVLIRPRTIAKTSSGKIQRYACRDAFLAGTLEVVAEWPPGDSPAPVGPEDGAAVFDRLRAHVAARFACAPAAIDPDAPVSRHGLDSLDATELAIELTERFGCAVGAVELLGGITPRQLAARITPAGSAAAARAPLPGAGPSEHLLSRSQRALWALQQLRSETPLHIVRAARVRALDEQRLARALATLADRHPALRTTIAPGAGGEPVARVAAPGGRLALERTRVADAALTARLRDEALRPFDLERGPLWRFVLLVPDTGDPVLVVAAHHLVADLWSLGRFAEELSALYAGGEAPPLPAWPPAAYAADEAALLERDGDELARYWSARLAELPPPLELPRLLRDQASPDRAAEPATAGAIRIELDAALGGALRALGQRLGATLFSTLAAALGALLQRYTGCTDVVIGVPAALRDRPELANTVGYLVNLLPLRIELGGDPTFEELVARTGASVRGALAHKSLPLAAMVEELGLAPRGPGQPPLLQVAFALQRQPLLERTGLTALALGEAGPPAMLGELELTPLALPARPAQFELAVIATEHRGGATLVFEYDEALFDAATVEAMARAYRTLLAGAVADPRQRMLAVPVIERAEIASCAAPPTEPLHARAELWAERSPSALAVVADGIELSYGALSARANQLAWWLRERGVGPGRLAAVDAHPSLDAVVAILAIHKAGGAYLPIDPSHPPARRAALLDDARPVVYLTASELASHGAAIAAYPTAPPPRAPGAEQLAYALFTSGSTGAPKAALLPHAGAVALIDQLAAHQPIRPGDACMSWCSLGFDVSIYEIYSALCAGGALHLAPPALRFEHDRLFAWMRLRQIHSAYLPPSALEPLCDWLDRGGGLALRRLLVGVEPIPLHVLRALGERIAGLRIVNGYGPTETSICATLYPVEPRSGAPCPASGRTPLGRAVGHQLVHLLDEHRRPVPIGAPGELFIGGAGVAHGYLGRADLTAERFVPDPFSGAPGVRLYRTGDRARRLSDGNLEFLGRIDDQLKVRGFRVEPGEIEAALRRDPVVADAIVVGRRDVSGELRLCAYVVPRAGSAISIDALRAELRRHLPGQMIPAWFVTLAALPRLPSGKPDRRNLPAPPAVAAPERAANLAEPASELERRLADVFCRALCRERVGVTDHFFDDLTLSSISIVKMSVLVSRELGTDVPVVRLFEHPTVRALARALTSTARPAGDRPSAETRAERLRRAVARKQRSR
jgi:amino acid adenylation domain-containing protein